MKNEFNYSEKPASIWDYTVPIVCGIGIIFGLIGIANLQSDKEAAKNPTITPKQINEAKENLVQIDTVPVRKWQVKN